MDRIRAAVIGTGFMGRSHLEALRRFGPCPSHRRSFAPVRDTLAAMPLQAQLPGLPHPA